GTHTGTFNIALGAALRQRDAFTRNYGAGSVITGAGSFQVWDGTTTFSGTTFNPGNTAVQDTGTLTLNSNAITSSLNLTGGALNGSGALTVTNSFTHTAGTFSKTGNVSITQ